MTGQPTSGFRLGYRPALDGLRALAVMAVFALHVGTPISRGGDLGVDIFFVLSGFLITALLIGELQRTGGVRYANFYLRRALRLCPALVVVVAAVVVEAVLIAPAVARTDALHGAVTSLLYVTNWTTAFGGWRGGVLAHTWSLSIEEQFYVLWPLCLLLLLGKQRRYRLAFAVTVAVAAASLIDRTVLWANGASYRRLQAGLDVRADQLLIGCALAIAIMAGWLTARSPIAKLAARIQWPVLVAILAAMALTRYSDAWLVTVGLTVFGVAAGALILSMVLQPASRLTTLFSWKPLVHLGRISYGFYLVHYPIVNIVGPHLPGSIRFVALLALSFLAAECLFRLVERPFLRLKSRLGERAPASVGVTASVELDVDVRDSPKRAPALPSSTRR